MYFTLCPIPSALSDNSLRGCWAKELDVASLSPPLPPVLVSLYLSLQQIYNEGKKNYCPITISHFQYTSTLSKLEGSPVIFYLLVYNLR